MSGYDDYGYPEDDRPSPIEDLTDVGFGAGYARALVDIENVKQNAADAAGDAIVRAAQSREVRGLWGDEVGWSEPPEGEELP